MALTIEQPGPAVRQVSGKDPKGRFILSVVVKRTFQLTDRGECVPSESPVPLVDQPLFNDKEGELLLHDSDLYPFKPRTDVVIKGHAYAYTQERQFTAGIHVGESLPKRFLVLGDRRCTRMAAGGLAFSPPRPVEKIPLSYTHAYGGRDTVAEAAALAAHEARGLHTIADFAPKGPSSPYVYPRNTAGRGYLINDLPAAVEAVQLPNLEDPENPLLPARMLLDHYLMWPRMPLPQASDWVSFTWFPRISGIGIAPPHDRAAQPFAEITRGLVPEAIIKPPNADAIDPFHLTCGASLGLQFPYLRGDEVITLDHIHPRHSVYRLKLPGGRLKIWTDGRKGKFNKTDPVIHTILLEPDESRVSIVWRGSAPALRPYMAEELKTMPLRVEW